MTVLTDLGMINFIVEYVGNENKNTDLLPPRGCR